MFDPVEIDHLFSPEECGRIIALADEDGFSDAGLVQGVENANIRRARIAWLDETGSAEWVFDRILAAVADANRERFGFDLTEFAERMQVAWYGGEAQGHFDWHADIGTGSFAAKRKLTIVVQLSDPSGYAGGALEIDVLGHRREASRSRGSATLFPSFLMHRVKPVSKGERYSLTLWCHGPAFR